MSNIRPFFDTMPTRKLPPPDLSPDAIAAWRARLAAEAEGLDLRTAEGRCIYRLRVIRATEDAHIRLLLALADDLGRLPLKRSRAAAARAVAEAWIENERANADEEEAA